MRPVGRASLLLLLLLAVAVAVARAHVDDTPIIGVVFNGEARACTLPQPPPPLHVRPY